MGFVSERDRVRLLGRAWGIEFIDLAEVTPEPQATSLVSATLARRHKVLPISLDGDRLHVAMANPLDIFVIDELRLSTGKEVEALIAVEEELEASIIATYHKESSLSDALKGVMSDFDSEIELSTHSDEDEVSAE